MAEFGIVLPKGITHVRARVPAIIDDVQNGLPGTARELFARLYSNLRDLGAHITDLELQIRAVHCLYR